MEQQSSRQFFIPAFVIGIALVLSASVVSYTLYLMKGFDNTLSVTGSAKQDIKADTAKWTVEVHRTVLESSVPNAYIQVAKDAETVIAYFKQAGIEHLTETTIFSDQDYSYSTDPNAPRRFTVRKSITIESSDVDKVADLSKNIGDLIAKGVVVSPMSPEYYVSTLPDIRVALLGKAVSDAKARADEIAKSGGTHVGKLKSAASGVVQVMSPNSTSVDDYGSYDTASIEKTVMVTARATFFVR